MNCLKKNPIEIPVFFSTDDNYLPFLAVTIRSLIDNASENYKYCINILNTGLNPLKTAQIAGMQKANVEIRFIDISERFKLISDHLILRDYYSPSIYFRLFIPSMFPEYSKAIYLDCDVVVLGDISEFYMFDISDKLLGAIPDSVVENAAIFREYVQTALGIPYTKYFNSGVLLMNLDEFRKNKIEDRFIELFNTYCFDSVAPDQDYLNYLCQGKILYVDKSWNKMTTPEEYNGKLNLIHYNMYKKPWLYSKVRYAGHFWRYAKKTSFYDEITIIKNSFTRKHMYKNLKAGQGLMQHAVKIINSGMTLSKLK